MSIKTALSFDDVQLLDSYCPLESRSKIDLTQTFHFANSNDALYVDLPIISAAMMTLDNDELAYQLIKAGGIYSIHRYKSVEDQLDQFNRLRSRFIQEGEFGLSKRIAVTIGVKTTEDQIRHMRKVGVRIILLDVAALNTKPALDQAFKLMELSKMGFIPILGNFSNETIVRKLADHESSHFPDGITNVINAMFLKVGQGGSKICSTRINTGVGKPTWQATYDLHQEFYKPNFYSRPGNINSNVPNSYIIADGGIKNSGDAMKAFGAGASLVMMGGFLSGRKGTIPEDDLIKDIDLDGEYYYNYGMASEYAKSKAGMPLKNIEGIAVKQLVKQETLQEALCRFKENLQSGISLCGYTGLQSFIGRGNFIQVTANGTYEAKTY